MLVRAAEHMTMLCPGWSLATSPALRDARSALMSEMPQNAAMRLTCCGCGAVIAVDRSAFRKAIEDVRQQLNEARSRITSS
jgi:hypothetical protein